MNIEELFRKYRSHISLENVVIIDIQNESIIDGEGKLNDKLNNKQYIILNNAPQENRYELILDIIRGLGSGISIYINESPDTFINKLKDKFESSKENNKINENVDGIAVQHIEGVGYIISTLNRSGLFTYWTFTPAEYDNLSKEIVVLGMAKNEEHYIKDWVAYHLRIGFDKIYLFDNNDENGERYDDLLSEYVDAGKLKIMNIRGRKGLQNAIYNSFYYTMPFKWVAIIDIDEYIWFNEAGKYCDIKTFLSSVCQQNDRFGIMLQWHCYAGSGDDKPADIPIWEANNRLLPFNCRKDNRCEYIHQWCKSIYKPGYPIVLNEHFAWMDGNCYCYEVDHKDEPIIKDNLLFIPEKEMLKQNVYIKHFLLRNIDDFYGHKYLRGHAGGDFGVGEDGWRFWQWAQNMNYFTDISVPLTEKEQIYLTKHGMKANYTFHPDVFVNFYMLDGNDHINAIFNDDIIYYTLLSMANCFVNVIHINVPKYVELPKDDSMKKNSCDLGFLARYMWNHKYFDVMMEDPGIEKQYIQEPIVINIGIPLKYAIEEVSIDEQKQYAETMRRIFSKDNLRSMLRSTLDAGTTFIPSIGTEDADGNCGGYKEDVEPWLQSAGLQKPNKVLFNNTMIMSYPQYKKLKLFQGEFIKRFGSYNNDFICENYRNNTLTPYHAYLNSVMSVIEKPYFIWPS